MKKLRSLLFMLCALFCAASFAQQPAKQTIKIVTYNIWNGFETEPSCRTNFVRWMNEQKPDVVAMQELRGFTEETLAELAKEYGHPYSVIVRKNAHQVALTSNQPSK